VSAFRGVATALVKGFVRDRTSLFFSMLFPLMFLVLFGGVLDFDSTRRDLIEVGAVPLVDDLSGGAKDAFDQIFEVRRSRDLDAALEEVRSGDADVAVEQLGDEVVAHYTRTDQVGAATVRGALLSFVDAANLDATGEPPRYTFRAEQVEDESLQPIQFFTPGLLGWAIATSAAVGAAATLQGWRQSRLLARLQLSPASAASVVSARVVVTVSIALVQMAVFVGLGAGVFGLQLGGAWWLSVPLLVLGTLCFMTVGLLAGAVSRTAEGAVNLANLVVLPMAFLSGSFFPLDGAPGWLRGLASAFPLFHLNEGMLDVLVRGEGVRAVAAPAAYLALFGLVVGTLAVVAFRRRERG
jgi:ABC-2 type transport system permease protein